MNIFYTDFPITNNHSLKECRIIDYDGNSTFRAGVEYREVFIPARIKRTQVYPSLKRPGECIKHVCACLWLPSVLWKKALKSEMGKYRFRRLPVKRFKKCGRTR